MDSLPCTLSARSPQATDLPPPRSYCTARLYHSRKRMLYRGSSAISCFSTMFGSLDDAQSRRFATLKRNVTFSARREEILSNLLTCVSTAMPSTLFHATSMPSTAILRPTPCELRDSKEEQTHLPTLICVKPSMLSGTSPACLLRQ